MACRKSSCLVGCSEITQSPEGNLARGFLPKSITTSIKLPISSWPYNSLLIFKGNNSRNSSNSEVASGREVEGEFCETDDGPFAVENRSEGLRISGDPIEAEEELEDRIAFWGRRVRRNDEETVEIMPLEVLRYARVEVGMWFAECHEVCRSISTKWEFKALILGHTL